MVIGRTDISTQPGLHTSWHAVQYDPIAPQIGNKDGIIRRIVERIALRHMHIILIPDPVQLCYILRRLCEWKIC